MNCAYCGSLDQKPANCVNCGAPIVRSEPSSGRGPFTFALIWWEDMMSDERLFLLLASRDRSEIRRELGELGNVKGLEHFGHDTPPMWRVPPHKTAQAIQTGRAKWSVSPYDVLSMSA